MALKFTGIQPVEFGNKACTPRIDADKKLRLSRIHYETETDEEEANAALASCFPDDEAFVLDFLKAHMTKTDKQYLQVYLTAGERGIEAIEQATREMMQKKMSEVAK